MFLSCGPQRFGLRSKLQDGGLQGSRSPNARCKIVSINFHMYLVSCTYIAYLAGSSEQDETNVAADWLQIDTRTQIAAVV
jgi:hypothetical protein